MLVVYMSLTGNTKNFVERTGYPSVLLNTNNPFIEINEPYVMVVPTYDDMEDVAIDFIEHKNNKQYLMGFAGGGNLNFAELYCFSAKNLSTKYKKPLILLFEFIGSDNDIRKFRKAVEEIGKSCIKEGN